MRPLSWKLCAASFISHHMKEVQSKRQHPDVCLSLMIVTSCWPQPAVRWTVAMVTAQSWIRDERKSDVIWFGRGWRVWSVQEQIWAVSWFCWIFRLWIWMCSFSSRSLSEWIRTQMKPEATKSSSESLLLVWPLGVLKGQHAEHEGRVSWGQFLLYLLNTDWISERTWLHWKQDKLSKLKPDKTLTGLFSFMCLKKFKNCSEFHCFYKYFIFFCTFIFKDSFIQMFESMQSFNWAQPVQVWRNVSSALSLSSGSLRAVSWAPFSSPWWAMTACAALGAVTSSRTLRMWWTTRSYTVTTASAVGG